MFKDKQKLTKFLIALLKTVSVWTVAYLIMYFFNAKTSDEKLNFKPLSLKSAKKKNKKFHDVDDVKSDS